MSEWWTYRLSSFLMFTPRIYWRLVEDYGRAVWPLQLVAMAAGLAMLWLAIRGGRRAAIAIALVLAAAWMQVAWNFFWTRYAEIFTAAPFLAIACATQAVLLAASAVRAEPARMAWLGWALAACAIVVYPYAGVALARRPLAQAECFGVMPDPTALATLGMVACLHARAWMRIVLGVIPAATLVIGWATLANLAAYGTSG